MAYKYTPMVPDGAPAVKTAPRPPEFGPHHHHTTPRPVSGEELVRAQTNPRTLLALNEQEKNLAKDPDYSSDSSEGSLENWSFKSGFSTRGRWLTSRGVAAMCLIWIATGVAMGVYIEGWTVLTSFYVIIQILTTIGYGDVTVGSQEMQVFMTFYVVSGLILVANVLTVVEEKIIEKYVSTAGDRLRTIEAATMGASTRSLVDGRRAGVYRLLSTSAACLVCALSGTLFFITVESCTCSYGVTHASNKIVEVDLPNGTMVERDICPVGSDYDTCMSPTEWLPGGPPRGFTLNWIEAFYMSVITMTTVGFGDYSPKSQIGRFVGILWMLISVSCTVTFLAAMAEVIKNYVRLDNLDAKRDENNEELFQAVDLDKNGYLDYAEYTRYVLLKHGFVQKEILLEIDRKFSKMDKNQDGLVSFDMIMHYSHIEDEEDSAP